MTADFDEYAYLEQQVEPGKDSEGALKDKDSAGKEEKRRSEKSSRRDRSRSRDRSSKRHRSRSRSRDKDRDSKHRSRDRDSGKDRDKDKDRDRDRDRDRRDKEKEPDRRERERREPPPRRERTPPEVRLQREREKELAELERDTRTVFAYNVNTRATDRDIFEFFSQAGTVMDVRIITDRNTKRSKGFAYIEMSSKMEVASALALTGQTLLGQSVMVKASEAEKNMAWEAQQATAAQQASAAQQAGMNPLMMGTGPCKLMVTNIHPNVGDSDLESIFSPFGILESAQIAKDAAGNSTGSAIVTFKQMSDAAKAMQQLNGLEIAGLAMSVSVAPVLAPPMEFAVAPLANVNELDEEAGGGLKLSAQSRAALMQRLSGASSFPGMGSGANNIPLGAPILPGPPPLPHASMNPLALEQGCLGPKSPIPTPCVLLKNMFDPATETEPDWDIEIGEDVKEECTKFGAVLHHHVDKNSKGFVYLKFKDTAAAQKAQAALHGRWFAGREVLAEYQFAAVYDSHFKC